MVEKQVVVATTPVVHSKARPSRSKSKNRHDASPSSSTAIASSPRKWSLFHRGNQTSPSKKQITLFQSRRRRQKQQNLSQNLDSQSTDRELPSNESKTGIIRRAAKKQNAKGPVGDGTNGTEVFQATAMEQPATSQSESPTTSQRDNAPPVNSSQRSWAAANATTRTENSDLPHLLQSSDAGTTPYRTTTGTKIDSEGSEQAVLIFDREKRTSLSVEPQEKTTESKKAINLGKTIGAVASIVILFWMLMYLPTKIVEGGERIISMYHDFASRMQTLAHFLRAALTVAAWAGTMFGWGYLVKNTNKFMERRRSDLNPTVVNLNNIGADNLTLSASRHDDHASQIHVKHDHDH